MTGPLLQASVHAARCLPCRLGFRAVSWNSPVVQRFMEQLRSRGRLLARARMELARLFSKVIERRRESGEKGNDVLQVWDHHASPSPSMCTP